MSDERGIEIDGRTYKEQQFAYVNNQNPSQEAIEAKDELLGLLKSKVIKVNHETQGLSKNAAETWLTSEEARRKFPAGQKPEGIFIHWKHAYSLRTLGRNAQYPVLLPVLAAKTLDELLGSSGSTTT